MVGQAAEAALLKATEELTDIIMNQPQVWLQKEQQKGKEVMATDTAMTKGSSSSNTTRIGAAETVEEEKVLIQRKEMPERGRLNSERPERAHVQFESDELRDGRMQILQEDRWPDPKDKR